MIEELDSVLSSRDRSDGLIDASHSTKKKLRLLPGADHVIDSREVVDWGTQAKALTWSRGYRLDRRYRRRSNS